MLTKAIKTPLAIVLLSALSLPVMADEVTKAAVQAKFPATPITDASPVADFPGLIEMVVGKNQIFYTNTDGSRLLIGHIFDPKTNTDLTQQKIESMTVMDWALLPLKDAITIKKGKGEREMAVFTDPECPYCKKLEEELKLVDNVIIHVFTYPLPMHAQAKPISESIWCAKDKAKAWSDFTLTGAKPANDGACTAAQAVSRNLALGEKLGITGTPAIIARNGKIKPGYMPAAQLDIWLNENAKAPITNGMKPRVGEKK